MRTQAMRQDERDRGDAFARLVDRDLDRVWRFLVSLVRDPELADDLCQETFLRLHAALAAGRVRELEDGLPRAAYVFAAARNAARSHGRARSRAAHVGVEAAERNGAAAPASARPDLRLVRDELGAGLEAALAALDEEHRAVFLLSEVEGLRYGEIAAVLGIPPGTVASRKHHAVQRLRRELERTGHAV